MAKKSTGCVVQAPKSGSTSVEVSVRKIDNGYITRKSSYGEGPKGYQSSEFFSPEPPKLEVRDVRGADRKSGGKAPASSSLSKAMKGLK